MNVEYVESSTLATRAAMASSLETVKLRSGQADAMASMRARTVLVRMHKDSKLTGLFFSPISQQTPPRNAKSLVLIIALVRPGAELWHGPTHGAGAVLAFGSRRALIKNSL